MIGICYWSAATKNRRIPETATGRPTVESPKRVPDSQTGQPPFVLDGRYPITDYYVNLGLTFQIDRHIFKQDPLYPKTQLFDALIESYGREQLWG